MEDIEEGWEEFDVPKFEEFDVRKVLCLKSLIFDKFESLNMMFKVCYYSSK